MRAVKFKVFKISKRLNQLAYPKLYPEPGRHPRYAVTKHGVSIGAIRGSLSESSKRITFLFTSKKNYLQKFPRKRLSRFGVSLSALKYELTPTIGKLAEPKKYNIREGKKRTQHGVSEWALSDKNKATEVLEKLAIPNETHGKFVGNPYEVKKSALKYEATNRIILLAEHRKYPKIKDKKRSKYTGIPLAALRGRIATERYLQLSNPRAPPPEEPVAPRTESGVVKNALKAKASGRTIELATPRRVRKKKIESPPEVNPDLTKSGVSLRALKGKASDRVQKLAKPREYTKPEKKDVTIFGLSKKALKYEASKRILELAVPKIVAKVK